MTPAGYKVQQNVTSGNLRVKLMKQSSGLEYRYRFQMLEFRSRVQVPDVRVQV